MQNAKWALAIVALMCAGCASGPVSRAEAEARLTQIAYDAQATATAQAASAEARITQVALQSISAANAATQAAAQKEMVAITATLQALPYALEKQALENARTAEQLRQSQDVFDTGLLICGGGIGLLVLVVIVTVGVNAWHVARDWRKHRQRMLLLEYTTQVKELLPPSVAVVNGQETPEHKWRAALHMACAWAEEIGWTERAWREAEVVYFAGSKKFDDQGRRRLVEILDGAGVTVMEGKEREWAAGWGAGAWERLLPVTPLLLPEVSPPLLKIPLRSSEVPKFSEVPNRGLGKLGAAEA